MHRRSLNDTKRSVPATDSASRQAVCGSHDRGPGRPGPFGWVALISISALLGCNDLFDQPEESTTSRTFSINTNVLRPAEDPLLEIANQVPAFAGYYCADGDLYVNITNGASENSKETLRDLIDISNVASSCMMRSLGRRTPNIILTAARYDFLTLRSWRDTLTEEFFEIPGADGIAIDYIRNRIELTVRTDSGAATSARAFASSFGLPNDSFAVNESSKPQLRAACPTPTDGYDVYSCFRPVPGGVAMIPMPNGGPGVLTGQGTITVAGYRWITQGSYWQSGFITCAHCVPPALVNNNDWVSQPDAPGDTPNARVIGVETADPPGWTCGSLQCRYSDSAFVTHTAGGAQTGTILQTLYWNGSKIRSTTNPRFYIVGSRTAVTGMEVEKVGVASGWRTGTVTNPCADKADGQGHKYICSGVTSLYGVPGDSGSPVFHWLWDEGGGNNVQIVGVLWGGPISNPNESWYSSWQNMKNDLGDLYALY